MDVSMKLLQKLLFQVSDSMLSSFAFLIWIKALATLFNPYPANVENMVS